MSSALEHLGERIAEHAAHLEAALHRLLVDLREFDRGGGYVSQGFATCAAWMSWRLGWSLVTSREHLRVAHSLERLPSIDAALQKGELSYSKVRALTRVATPANEGTLLHDARYTTASQLETLCRKLESVQRADDPPDPRRDAERRQITRRDLADGMVRIVAVLHAEEAAIVWAALDRIAAERCHATTQREEEPFATDGSTPAVDAPHEPTADALLRMTSGRAERNVRARTSRGETDLHVPAPPSQTEPGVPAGTGRPDPAGPTKPVPALQLDPPPGQAEPGPEGTSEPSRMKGPALPERAAPPKSGAQGHWITSGPRTERFAERELVRHPRPGAAVPAGTSPAHQVEPGSPPGQASVPAGTDRPDRAFVPAETSPAQPEPSVLAETGRPDRAVLGETSSDFHAEPSVPAGTGRCDRAVPAETSSAHAEPSVPAGTGRPDRAVPAEASPDFRTEPGLTPGEGVWSRIDRILIERGQAPMDSLAAGSRSTHEPPLGRPPAGEASREAPRRVFDRVDALVEISTRVLRGAREERSPVEIILTVPAAVLRSDQVAPTDPAQLACFMDGTSISRTAARRLACDAGVVRLVEDEHGNPLSIGRKTRTISGALKRALLRRDRTCRFPGCENRVFLEAHHIQHWADGGSTDVSNVLLTCGFHHRFVHEYGFTVELAPDGSARFLDPSGRAVAPAPVPAQPAELGWPSSSKPIAPSRSPRTRRSAGPTPDGSTMESSSTFSCATRPAPVTMPSTGGPCRDRSIRGTAHGGAAQPGEALSRANDPALHRATKTDPARVFGVIRRADLVARTGPSPRLETYRYRRACGRSLRGAHDLDTRPAGVVAER
jgi:hypothetical protein